MVVRKQIVKKKEEKPKVETSPSRKVTSDVKALPEAIVDGKFVANVGEDIIVVRRVAGKTQKSVCIVKEVSVDYVSTWDDTMNRWFAFNPADVEKHDIVVKKAKL